MSVEVRPLGGQGRERERRGGERIEGKGVREWRGKIKRHTRFGTHK